MNINLDRYREGKAHWGAVAYTKASSQYGKYDKNEKNRYAVLLSSI